MSTSSAKKTRTRASFTVSSQVAAVVVGSLGIAFLVVIGLEIAWSHAFQHRAALRHSIQLTESLARHIYDPMRRRELEIIRQSHDALSRQEGLEVAAAATVDAEGAILTTYQRPDSEIDLSALLREMGPAAADPGTYAQEMDDLLIVVTPVLSHDGSRRAGTLVMAWGHENLHQLLGREATRQIAAAVAALVIFAILALMFVHIRLSKPLADITAATNLIANGDKRSPVPWTERADEIGHMARSLVTFRENVALIDRLTAEQQQQTMRLSNALQKERDYNALHREFVSMVSHEFRTPVAIIDGAAQRIDRRAGKDTPEELRQRTTKIRAAVRRMIELIDSTLSLSRIEAGTIELELADCDLGALLHEICQRQQEIAEDHRISLTIADLPPAVRVDPKRMDQVLTNILSNAVKYSPGAPLIDVKAETVGGKIVIAVRDYGLGIPKDELPKLFGKFFRASTSTGIPGTGIGLHLVRHLMELHSGTAEIDSTEGQGTTISITLPPEAAIWMEPAECGAEEDSAAIPA